MLFVTIWLLARLRHRSRVMRLVPENSVVEMYLAIQRQLSRLGVKQKPGETARGFLLGAGKVYSELLPACRRLAPVYERAAYSGAVPSDEDLALAAESLDQIRSYVREELQRRKQRK